MPKATVVLNVNRRTGISTWSHARSNEKRKRNRRRRRRILTSYAVQIQVYACVELQQRWNAHNAVSKVTVARSASWLTGKNTNSAVSHTPQANQPHPQTTGLYIHNPITISIIISCFYSIKEIEIPSKDPDNTSVATGSVASITADDTKEHATDKPVHTGSILGSNDSLLDDKV